MRTQLIVLNGGSSSGKSGIARCLQAVLPDPWLAMGVDALIHAMPASMKTTDAKATDAKATDAKATDAKATDAKATDAKATDAKTADAGITFASDGRVIVGPEFGTLQAAWMEGVAAMVRAGARIILDEVFLGGAASQQQWRKVLAGLDVLWVGVRCESAVAAGREVDRGDRIQGMAVSQAEVVHQGVVYDLEVDTTHTEALVCARTIAAQLS